MRKQRYYLSTVDEQARTLPTNAHIEQDKHGRDTYIDDYGGGSIHSPVFDNLSQLPEVIKQNWQLWAQDRLPWARENAISEVPELERIAVTGNRHRTTCPSCHGSGYID